MSTRISNNRLRNLWSGTEGRRLRSATEGLDAAALDRLVAMARINLEQAQAASRVTIFINVTIIVAVVMVTNQIFPGWIQTALVSESWYSGSILGVLVAFVGLAGFTSAYSWGGVAFARDLLHLLELRAAGLEGGLRGGLESHSLTARPAAQEGDPVSDLRSAQLSDL